MKKTFYNPHTVIEDITNLDEKWLDKQNRDKPYDIHYSYLEALRLIGKGDTKGFVEQVGDILFHSARQVRVSSLIDRAAPSDQDNSHSISTIEIKSKKSEEMARLSPLLLGVIPTVAAKYYENTTDEARTEDTLADNLSDTNEAPSSMTIDVIDLSELDGEAPLTNQAPDQALEHQSSQEEEEGTTPPITEQGHIAESADKATEKVTQAEAEKEEEEEEYVSNIVMSESTQVAPETVASETVTSETVTSETVAIETVPQETDQSDTVIPETAIATNQREEQTQQNQEATPDGGTEQTQDQKAAESQLEKIQAEYGHQRKDQTVPSASESVQIEHSKFTSWLNSLPRLDEMNQVPETQPKSTIISESYAKLLVDQGHNTDAITMYEQLMLKYPEKSSFFAVQIKKLK